MDKRRVTLVSVKPLLMELHHVALSRYTDTVLDYLTPKKLGQLLDIYISSELARRMVWAEYDETILDECVAEVFARAPWHRGDESLLEDIRAHVYDPLMVTITALLDAHGVGDRTANVWHHQARPKQEYLLINEGDYRIHAWNKLSKNCRSEAGLQWDFDQGLYGFGITQAWRLPRDGGGLDLDHPGDH